jgi:HK97 family phage major capsid protein
MTDLQVREPDIYEPGSPHSFLLDVARATAWQDEAANERLHRHQQYEMRTNPNTTTGTGGEFAPPGYLIDLFTTSAKTGRHFADLIGSNPMPRGVSQINVPRWKGTDILGQDTGVTTDGAAEPSFDPTSDYKTTPVISIAGSLVVSQQLYDQAGGPGFDVIGGRELAKDYNAVLNYQLVNGSGSAGQLTGLANFTFLTSNDVDGSAVPASVAGGLSTGSMISALWPLLGLAAANVGNNRGHRPDWWLMSPRRWFAMAGSLDQQYRPIMSPQKSDSDDTATITAGGPHAVANIHGIPVYTEGSIPVTTYTGGVAGTIGAKADTVYCGRVSDLYLFESAPMVQASVNATAGTLQVRVSLHRYAAFVNQLFPSAFARVRNIPQPTTPGNF